MALSGVHIECGYAGGQGIGDNYFALRKTLVWSETLAGPGTTSNSAPAANPKTTGSPIFSIIASQAIFYATGLNPDPVNGPRRFLGAGIKEDLFVNQDDKFAWTLA